MHPTNGCDDNLFTLTLNTKRQPTEGTLLITCCLTDQKKKKITSLLIPTQGWVSPRVRQSSYCLWETDPVAVGPLQEVTGKRVHSGSLIRWQWDLLPGMTGKRVHSKKSSLFNSHTPGTRVKFASTNTVYGPNSDLPFIENFIESTKIYSSKASNAAPLTHDCFIRKKGFILISDIYEVPREILETPRQRFLLCPPSCRHSYACNTHTEVSICPEGGASCRLLIMWRATPGSSTVTRSPSQRLMGDCYTRQRCLPYLSSLNKPVCSSVVASCEQAGALLQSVD